MVCVKFLRVTVTPYPEDDDHAPLKRPETRALSQVRILRAGDVETGDLILAYFQDGRSVYPNSPYLAEISTYNRKCGCGVCCLLADVPGAVVVLSNEGGWCDPWPSDDLVLVLPRIHRRLHPRRDKREGT